MLIWTTRVRACPPPPFHSSSIRSFVYHTPLTPVPTPPHISNLNLTYGHLARKTQPTQPTAARARTERQLPARPRACSSTPTSVRTSYYFSERVPIETITFFSNAEGDCPNSYVYAFDQGSGTALWTCNSTLNSDYRLTFCPCVYPVYSYTHTLSNSLDT